jgi:two-component system, OmpR family, sensor histidine kinase MprB
VTLRRRLALMSALAAGVTIAVASLACYLVMRSELRAQVDRPLRAQVERIALRRKLLGRDLPGGPAEVSRIVAPDAVQLGRPLKGVDNVLSRLRVVLVALVVLGTAFAAALARLVARPVVRPITARFDAMLDRVQASQLAQRRLVADASHELRTPVTSLRTNTEVLLAGAHLDEGEGRALLRDMVGQSEELSTLVGDLIELARGDDGDPPLEEVAFDRLVAEAVERARRDAPGVRFCAELAPCTLRGVPDRLGRAVDEVLENAARHGPPDGRVEVALRGGTLTVRDYGSGVAREELGLVFDRFFRGAGARGRQGSGLGLSIVKQVVGAHGGAVEAANAPGGGLVFTLTFPAAEEPALAVGVRVA